VPLFPCKRAVSAVLAAPNQGSGAVVAGSLMDASCSFVVTALAVEELGSARRLRWWRGQHPWWALSAPLSVVLSHVKP